MEEMTEAQEDRIFSGETERKAEEKMRYEDMEGERRGDIAREEGEKNDDRNDGI